MSDKPILFSGPMVQAILAGAKTQTRRVVKCKARSPHGKSCRLSSWSDGVAQFGFGNDVLMGVNDWSAEVKCPFKVGMKLWIKETFAHGVGLAACEKGSLVAKQGATPAPWLLYRADGVVLPAGCHWRPSLFMRREYSRITLLVTDVRCERLQDISEADARAEGCRRASGARPQTVGMGGPDTARDDYRDLWDSINGKKLAWRDNPAVWVVSFKRVSQ